MLFRGVVVRIEEGHPEHLGDLSAAPAARATAKGSTGPPRILVKQHTKINSATTHEDKQRQTIEHTQ